MLRLFAALLPDDTTVQQLLDISDGIDGARWIHPENFHLTMRFIGSVNEDRADELKAVLSTISAPPINVSIHGVGTFPELPTKYPLNVLWTGVEETEEMRDLAAAIDKHVVMTGSKPEERPFHAHITVARIKFADRGDVVSWLDEHDDLELPGFTARKFHLMESFPGPMGVEYRELASYPLRS